MVARVIFRSMNNRDYSLSLLSLCSAVLIVSLGCGLGEEKVIKPLNLVAMSNDGRYSVDSFLIDGEVPNDPLYRLPGTEVRISLTFTRHRQEQESQDANRPINLFPLTAYVLVETKESDLYKAGSQTQCDLVEVPNQPGTITQTVNFSLNVLDAATADFAQKYTLERYCKIVIAEGGTEIASQKIMIAGKK